MGKNEALFTAGDKFPHPTSGYVKIMAVADGYVMWRLKGCIPKVNSVNDMTEYIKDLKTRNR